MIFPLLTLNSTFTRRHSQFIVWFCPTTNRAFAPLEITLKKSDFNLPKIPMFYGRVIKTDLKMSMMVRPSVSPTMAMVGLAPSPELLADRFCLR